MTNVVLYVEFEVLTRYPSRAVLNSFGSGYWRIGLDRRWWSRRHPLYGHKWHGYSSLGNGCDSTVGTMGVGRTSGQWVQTTTMWNTNMRNGKRKNESVKETKREQKKEDNLESMLSWRAGQERIWAKCCREWGEACCKSTHLEAGRLALAGSEPFLSNNGSGGQTKVNLGLCRW